MEWMWAAMGATSDRTSGYTGTGTNTTGYQKAFAGSTGSNAIGDFAWNNTNSVSTTHTVGTKTENELGLRDMSGNVWEWNWDCYAAYPATAQTDYRGAAPSTGLVLRGGGWNFVETYCFVAYRINDDPDIQYSHVGFRVVRP
jgi:formylglycine-generating enzyme required for sulfatase activity